jgi:mannan endo-1,4-beta-mannosidase
MKHWNRTCMIILILSLMLSLPASGQDKQAEPVTPKASPEARALLAYFYALSGKHFLSGQHNYPNTGERNSQFAANYIGKTPVVWSQDFGFAKDGDTDSYLARPDIIKEAIRQHQQGHIITLCWHAVPPTAEEPVTFRPLPGYDTAALASVQGQLLDQQFEDVLTPGTALHKQWLKQVDAIASFLKQLQEANVPVLWRPYHEMNGDWFWWGGRYEGTYTTVALYKQLFDRMVKHHKLNNLIWLWSVDRPSQPGREFDRYYPGNDCLDILSLDVYGNDFSQSYYDGLMELSAGKPLVLGEVGNPPAPEILDTQPNWAYWVVWAGMVRGTSLEDYEKITSDPRYVFYEDQAYLDGTVEYRKACGFGPLIIDRSADFTGEWLMSECESNVQQFGPMGTPYKLSILQQENELKVTSASVVEWGDDAITEQTFPLDGSDLESTTFMNAPRIQNAYWSREKDTLTIDSKVSFNFGDRPMEMKSKEVWTLKKRGNKLEILRSAQGFMGRGGGTSIMVYNKQ